MFNIVYKRAEDEFILGKFTNGAFQTKKYIFENILLENFSYPIKLFWPDTTFNFYYHNFALSTSKKFTISQLNEKISYFPVDKNEKIVGFFVNNIFINQKPKTRLLGQKGDISFGLGIYTLPLKELDNIYAIFPKEKKITIYPSSIFTLECISKYFDNTVIVFFDRKKTKLIQIVNGFYSKVAEIEIGLNFLDKKILETFKEKVNYYNLGSFQKEVYKRIIEEFLQPITIFIKTNAINDKIAIIGNISHYYNFNDILSKKLNLLVIPLKLTKNNLTGGELDLFCFKKQNAG